MEYRRIKSLDKYDYNAELSLNRIATNLVNLTYSGSTRHYYNI